jgi:hypothetical protein
VREREQYAIAAAARKRELLLLRQFQFLQLRQEAMERAEVCSTLWIRLKWLVNPALRIATVDATHRALIDKENAEAKQEAAKPKIQVVGAL